MDKWELIECWDEPILRVEWPHVQGTVYRVTRELYQQCTISRWTHTAPADDPNLPQTAPQPPGEKLYVP